MSEPAIPPDAAAPAAVADGALVRCTSPLYREYGVGRVRKVRDGHAKVEFNPSVFMVPPAR